jgi:hypothetical protein
MIAILRHKIPWLLINSSGRVMVSVPLHVVEILSLGQCLFGERRASKLQRQESEPLQPLPTHSIPQPQLARHRNVASSGTNQLMKGLSLS